MGTMDTAVIELHIFCDASPTGFGPVGFRVETHENSNIFVNIVTAKSHVVPLNPSKASHHNSIPRLELVGAENSWQILNAVANAIKIPFIRTVMWSNSETILKQI